MAKLERIYKILDSKDNSYNAWYGTQDDVVEYLHEHGAYEPSMGWIYGLEKLGLSFKIINKEVN